MTHLTHSWPYPMRRFLFIVGAMKCGTTSLFRHLEHHPEVCVPSTKKEPDFFGDSNNWERGIDWYVSNWNFDQNKHRIAVDASTNYSKIPSFPNAAERISEIKRTYHDVRFRFIYMMRDPIRRIESQLGHEYLEGRRPLRARLHPSHLSISDYYKQISEYYRRFDKDDILLLNFDDLVSAPEETMRRVCRFAGIDDNHSFNTLSSVFNPTAGREVNLSVAYRRMKKFIPWRSGQFLDKKIRAYVKSRARLTEAEKAYVIREIGPSLKLLEQYEFDISGWRSLG